MINANVVYNRQKILEILQVHQSSSPNPSKPPRHVLKRCCQHQWEMSLLLPWQGRQEPSMCAVDECSRKRGPSSSRPGPGRAARLQGEQALLQSHSAAWLV